jgi:hypothetical protein
MTVAKNEKRLAFSSASYLSRLLDRPDLLGAVRSLSGERFRELVTGIGLEDAGEIVALASAEQLETAFDDDLFRSRAPGEDEELDVDRFLLWLEVLREAGDTFAAERLASLSEDFLTVIVEASALVIDEDVLGGASVLHGRRAVARLESLIESKATEEIDRFCLISRRPRGFDALVAVLTTMDQDHHELVSRVLEAASRASFDTLEQGDDEDDEPDAEYAEYAESPRGFGARLGDDVAHEREDRRAARGFVPAASARAFLTAAREGIGPKDERDPTTHAVFRDMAALRPSAPKGMAPAKSHARAPTPWLPEATPERREPHGLTDTRDKERVFHRELRRLLAEEPALYTERVEEVAYLVNALVAGSSFAGRSIRPVEAFELALATVELGIALGHEEPRNAVTDTSVDVLFRRGFEHLHREVVLPAARFARDLLARVGGRDSTAEVRALDEAISSGRPWLARERFVDAMPSDDAKVEILAGLFDASPHRGGSRAPSFLATLADVDDARKVLARPTSKKAKATR